MHRQVGIRESFRNAVLALNRELGNPFTFNMDAIMRGRFKAYSGPEVKGLNIVNLILCERAVSHKHSASEDDYLRALERVERRKQNATGNANG
jgi:hypothetical protein